MKAADKPRKIIGLDDLKQQVDSGMVDAAGFNEMTVASFAPDAAKSRLLFSPDGRLLSNFANYNSVQVWDVARRARRYSLQGASSMQLFAPDGQTLATGYIETPAAGHRAEPPTVRLWDAQSGALKRSLPAFGPAAAQASGLVAWLMMAFSPDGKTLCTAANDHRLMLWDVASGALKSTMSGHASFVQSLHFSADGKRLLSAGQDNVLKLWDARSGRLLATMVPLPEASEVVQARAIMLGDKAIMLGDKDAAGNGEWFVTTPEGFFDCSANAAKFIRWNVGGQLFPAERYYRRFRRPDLVQKALRGEPITESAFTNDDVPPTAQFTGLKYEGNGPAAAVTVTLDTRSRSEVKAEDVTLLVNGRPLPPDVSPQISDATIGASPAALDTKAIMLGDKAIMLGDKAIMLGDKSAAPTAVSEATRYKFARRFTFNVPLPLGAKEVQLRAVAYDSNGLGSNWAQMTPLSRPDAKPVAGNLYVLCVGVGDYKNADGTRLKNLKFAAGDARAVAARLQQEGQPLYQKVEVYNGGPLLDATATPQNIRAGLKWLQEQVRPGQVDTVVFLSGHGLSDAQGRYFFPTYLFDAHDIKNTSISGEELQQELGGKLRAKSVFLFVDTCHSGALAGARSDDLNFDINASGVYMMASSGSAQSSYESASWGHGAFTLALLKSLDRRELARDGAIRFDVLTYAVPAEIARLLREAQQNPGAEEPVVPLEGRRLDEPVAQAR